MEDDSIVTKLKERNKRNMKYSQCYSKIDLVLKLSEQQQKSVFSMKENWRRVFISTKKERKEKSFISMLVFMFIFVFINIRVRIHLSIF